MKRSLRSCILILLGAVVLQAQDIDGVVKSQMQTLHIPGASVAVIKDGVLVKAEGYGIADMEHGIAARPDTVYKIGSTSKQFIAAGIMLLVQDGKVAVDDKVTKYLSDAPATWQSITLRHLLTHTSGLVREGPGFDGFKGQPDIDVIKTAYPLALEFKPGEKYEYSNLGYFVLAEIISRVSRKPWTDFLTERIFAPLGMTATRPTSVSDIVSNRADGYLWNGTKFENVPNWTALRPSGAFLSTVLDMAKWEAALNTDRILTAATKREMWMWVKLNDGTEFPYGFGWQLNDWPANSPVRTGVVMIRHGGSIPGFRANFSRWPSKGLAIVVLTNLEDAPLDGLVANIAIRYAPELRTEP